ncbi:MAG: XRE family transcriptional regulator [Pseudomonadota bacterium]|nr:XRE family transcriptional regulator [Pseudomonadota bacterium]
MKPVNHEIVEMESGSENVYLDLGYKNASEMLVKAQLATKIRDILKRRHLTQTDAAKLLHLTQPKLSSLLRGQFRGISEAKMMECLTLLGRDVKIVVKTSSRLQPGKLSVVFSG